ncbi:hypothetical protein FE257_006931 [Aspergillus nanangensis]|uniref:Uncharacterized protein n=1 Tax=Aspergillus nanangensis TaxID=2582783 RepID=A0AAD4GUL4_ASPNN|nr:hypothetical protein FE257_006931 [Aspergillus nanangensis]
MSECDSGSKNCNFTCPKGGSWFVCPEAPYFVGCCSSDPCHNTTETTSPCPNVHPASFKSDIYGSLRPNTCINSGKWWTCQDTNPTFIGCCKGDPCGLDGGCPDDKVTPAAWSPSSLGQKKLFLDGAPDQTSSPQPTGSNPPSDSHGLSTGAIAGIAIGAAAVVVLAAIAGLLFWRRRRRGRDNGMGPHRMDPNNSGQMYHPVSQYGESQFSSSPRSPNAKHRASSSIGSSAFPSPSFFTDSRPMSEAYTNPRSGDYTHLGQGLNIEGANIGPILSPKVVAVPELDSTPKQAYELEGR